MVEIKFQMAPGAGFEPAANWLTANCSTTELPGRRRGRFFKKESNRIKSARK